MQASTEYSVCDAKYAKGASDLSPGLRHLRYPGIESRIMHATLKGLLILVAGAIRPGGQHPLVST